MARVALAALAALVAWPAQPAAGQPGGGVLCPASGGFTGSSTYVNGAKPMAAPLLGSIACVDKPVAGGGANIYGPFENGFYAGFLCASQPNIVGGIDTNTANNITNFYCGKPVEILDACGGHAQPYHYHERMTCLYSQDAASGHSTRIGTALDGRGLYGKYVNGSVVPTDLDGCNGRWGVTPDSGGATVYYYVLTDRPPFSFSCFGPATVEQCKALYPEKCSAAPARLTSSDGSFDYKLFCPCFDSAGLNTPKNLAKDSLGAAPGSSAATLATLLALLFALH
jgi:hypothetical protein